MIKRKWINGETLGDTDDALMPGPLLHDDSLIVVDRAARTNTIGGEDKTIKSVPGSYSRPTFGEFPLADAADLQPFNMAAGEEKCLLLEVAIPSDQPAGRYVGALTIEVGGVATVTVPVILRVLPFEFSSHAERVFGIYYPQILDLTKGDDDTLVGAFYNSHSGPGISQGHMLAELIEMQRAGVVPTVYTQFGTDGSQQRANFLAHLQLMNLAGFSGVPIYWLGDYTGNYSRDSAGAASIAAKVLAVKAVIQQYGFTDLYFYGRDEQPAELAGDEILFAGVHAGGGKNYVATNLTGFAAMTQPALLDMPVLSGYPSEAQVLEWRNAGSLVAKYATPQAGPMSPATMRINMGARLWAMGIGGPFTWSFYSAANDIWNSWDHASYNDEIMCFPDANPGVIPTLAWRGYREAVLDIKYLDTLEAAIVDAPPSMAAVAQKAAEYVDSLRVYHQGKFNSVTPADVDYDLDLMRGRVIQWIEALQ